MFLAFTALAQNLLSTFARSCVAATSLGWSTKDLVGQSQLWPALHQSGKFQPVSTALLGKIGLLKTTPRHSAAGPDTTADSQDVPSWNNGSQAEKSWRIVQT